MSELKTVHAFDVYEAYTKTGDDDAAQVYIKSEADKVIEELEKYIDELQDKVTDLLLRDRNMALYFNKVFNALARYKYKHCLNMAYKCLVSCQKSKDLYRWAEDENLEHHYNHKIEFFATWHNRWRKLAEKFKEA